MLSYILLFILITVVILGVMRASKQTPSKRLRPHKEPFVGVSQREVVDEVEMVGEPRVISRAHHSVAAIAMDDEIDDMPEEDVVVVNTPRVAKARGQEVILADVDASLLFAVKPEQEVVAEKEVLDDLVVLHLVARADSPYRGYELLQAMLAVGLRYGKWNIFHRHAELTGRGPILFSVTSSIEPGTFDLAKMGNFSTAGLTLFMRTSNLENPQEALDILGATVQQLIHELGGAVCDEKHVPLSPEKLASLRERYLEKI